VNYNEVTHIRCGNNNLFLVLACCISFIFRYWESIVMLKCNIPYFTVAAVLPLENLLNGRGVFTI